jgi:hypothetical protein
LSNCRVTCLPIYPLAPVMRTFFIVELSHRPSVLSEWQLLNYGSGVNETVEADFLALPLTAVSDAAISTANDVRV